MGVGEDPVGEDGMDIDAPAWPPAGVEAADEGVIREGDPGDFYMKVIAKKFRGVWHYGMITGVVTEWVLEDYGGATQWRAVFEDGDTVDLLRSEVVEAMAAAQEHPLVDADGEARLITVPEGDDQSSESEEEGWEGGGDAAGAGWTSDEEEEEEEAHLRAWESAAVPGSDTNALTFAVMKSSAQVKSKNYNNSAYSEWQLLHDIMPAGFTWGGMAVPRSHKAMRKFLRVPDTSRYVRHMCPKGCVAFSGAPGKAGGWANLPDQHCPECNADRFIRMPQSLKLTAARVWYVLSVADIIKGWFRDHVWYACWKKGTHVSINAFRASSEAERLNEGGHGTGLAAGDFLHADNGIYTLTDDGFLSHLRAAQSVTGVGIRCEDMPPHMLTSRSNWHPVALIGPPEPPNRGKIRLEVLHELAVLGEHGARAAWEHAVDFKDHLEKLLDDVRRTELESEEELPRNLLAEREDAKYTAMVARAQHFYLATPPPPPGADSDDSRASARSIRAALCTVWTPERAHTAVGLDLWRVPGGGGGSGGEEALVLLDGPGIRKVAVLMAPADMSSAKAADLGVDAGELLVAGIHARSQDVRAKCKCYTPVSPTQ
eukprot:jgi/Tetstr1/425937/TSEL_016289.t1